MLRSALVAMLCLSTSAGVADAASIDWTTYANNSARNNYNPSENTLNAGNAGSVHLHWATDLGGPMLAQPTLVRQVATATGPQDLVYAATLYGVVYALNAQTGAIVWKRQLQVTQTQCGDFAASGDKVGVIATPTIDLPNGRMFVIDGHGLLHALALGTGLDQSRFPATLIDSANKWPRTFVYGSPTLVGSAIYAATASACDITPYHGQVIKYDLTRHAVTARFYTDGKFGPDGGGIWGPGGVSAAPDGSALYAATGNAFASPEYTAYGEHVVALDPAKLAVLAANAPGYQGGDVDFGATPLVFQPPGCGTMLAAMNKSGALAVYNAANINAGPIQSLQIAIPGASDGSFIGVPTYSPDTNLVYLGSPADYDIYTHGLNAFSVGANCQLSLAWHATNGQNAESYNNPMIPPAVAGGVVWYVDGDASELYAYDATTGAQLFYQPLGGGQGLFVAPAVINGQVFVAAFDHKLYAFGL